MLNRDRLSELFKYDDDSQSKRRALLLSTLFMSITTILFTIIGMSHPIPLPAEEGQFVLLGFEEEGEIVEDPVLTEEPVEEIVEEVVPPPVDPVQAEAEQVIETSDAEDAPELNASEEPVEAAPPETPVETPEPEPEVKKTEQDMDELAKLLTGGNTAAKGNPEGNDREIGEGVIKFKKTGFGSIGIAEGSGRGLVVIPEIDDKTQEKADIFIKVTVDKSGKVVDARNDLKRSTSTTTALVNKSLAAAKATVFQKMESGPAFTVEILEFNYRLE